MKRLARALIVVCLLAFVAGPVAAAGSGSTHLFVGLWKAIDTLDGSEILLSISKVDGEIRILSTETFFSVCKKEGFAGSPGLLEGTGTIHNKTLTWDFTFRCYDSDNDILMPHPDSSIAEGMTSFTLIPQDDILIQSDFGNVFHRIGSH